MSRLKIILIGIIFIGQTTACNNEFLEIKPSKSLVVPSTIADLQALLDNINVFNVAPSLNLISSDELVTTDAGWKSLSTPFERNSYIWAKDIFEGGSILDWDTGFKQIFYTNVILEQADKIKESSKSEINVINGSARFLRAFAYYNLLQLFAAPYQEHKADIELGLPIRLEANVDNSPPRATIRETYQTVINDLLIAKDLLPEVVRYKSRPNRNAAIAMLARVYLSMSKYEMALNYASLSLSLNDKLIDYNTLSTTASRPFPVALPNNNDEIIFFTELQTYTYIILYMSSTMQVNPEVYSLYKDGDLRKLLFFNSSGKNFKGTYNTNLKQFGGLATDEMYLIKAECMVRNNDMEGALIVLNRLLKTRWDKDESYPTITSSNMDEALKLILLERKKELLCRGLRWTDLRRLNLDSDFAVTLTRTINGVEYTLPPNSLRYIFPIPEKEVGMSNLQQNQR